MLVYKLPLRRPVTSKAFKIISRGLILRSVHFKTVIVRSVNHTDLCINRDIHALKINQLSVSHFFQMVYLRGSSLSVYKRWLPQFIDEIKHTEMFGNKKEGLKMTSLESDSWFFLAFCVNLTNKKDSPSINSLYWLKKDFFHRPRVRRVSVYISKKYLTNDKSTSDWFDLWHFEFLIS